MANSLYISAKSELLNGLISWDNNTIQAVLATSGYSPTIASDTFLSSVGSANILGRSSVFTGKTTTTGTASAATCTFIAPTSGTASSVVIYQNTGSDSTSLLICYLDTATGLPVVADGVDNIIINWDASGIFAL